MFYVLCSKRVNFVIDLIILIAKRWKLNILHVFSLFSLSLSLSLSYLSA